MALRNASGEAMVSRVLPPSPTPKNRYVAVVEDAAEDALVDVDALDLVDTHLERLPLNEAGLVDDTEIGDVGLGGPSMEPGGDRFVQRAMADIAANARQTASVRMGRHHPRRTRIRTLQSSRLTAEIYPVRVGRIQHLLAGLQDFVDITAHTPALN